MSTLSLLPQVRLVPSRRVALASMVLLAAGLVALPGPLSPAPAVLSLDPSTPVGRPVDRFGQPPVSFEPNVGQAPGRYDFVTRGQGFGMAIDSTGASLALGTDEGRDLLRMDLVGADDAATPHALDPLAGTVNWVVGDDESAWRSGVPTFGRVSYRDVLPGIDISYYGTDGGALEYDFVVAPNADPGFIRVAFDGADDVALRDGSLVITTGTGALTQEAPVLYQSIEGRRVSVEGGYVLTGDEVGFEVGGYDRNRPLVIDPVLAYSSYLGGSGEEVAWAIAVDGAGAAYVTGYTTSVDFPSSQAAFQASSAGSFDAFVTKLDATGWPVYSTYLGGSLDDLGHDIAVDGSGAAYAVGHTASTNFPTLVPFQSANAGASDAFVTKLDATGMPVYSTYLGGSGGDFAEGIAVSSSGVAYLTGMTSSPNFPTAAPFLGSYSGVGGDGFVAKLDASGQSLVYSTYLGGTADDEGFGIAVDGAGAAYVGGYTLSTNFPVLGAVQPVNAGDKDVFVTKLNASGRSLVYSTYLGGYGEDVAYGIAVDGAGAAYVSGHTLSTSFLTAAARQPANAGNMDAFVTKLSVTGQALDFSTYLGGAGTDGGAGIALDKATGSVYLTGYTDSANFPVQAPFQATIAGSKDVFVTELDPTGQTLIRSTYLGGSSGDYSQGIAVDGAGAAYVVGYTGSLDYPMQTPFQAAHGGGNSDGFVTKLNGTPPATCGGRTVTIQVAAPNQATSGTHGNDVIRGTTGIDVINGLRGNDIICGLRGNDRISGGSGWDRLYGDAGKDRIMGNEEGDKIYGDTGDDRISGGDGRDLVRGDDGNDKLYGDAGNDWLYGNKGGDLLHGGPGADTCNGGPPPTGDSATSCNIVSFVP